MFFSVIERIAKINTGDVKAPMKPPKTNPITLSRCIDAARNPKQPPLMQEITNPHATIVPGLEPFSFTS